MKIRMIAAIALLPLLLIVLLALPSVCTAVLVGLMAAVGAYELLCGTGLVKEPRLVVYTAVMGLLIGLWSHFGMVYTWLLVGILLFSTALFAEMLLSQAKLPFTKVAVCFAGGVIVPLLLCALVRIRGMENGQTLVLTPFVMAFLSDSGAYFAGRAFGKHKLAPVISPNKTVEGVLGGLLGGVVGMVVFCLVLQLAFSFQINYLYALIYGLLGSLASVFGDLSFSAIKRQTGIKDYGKLIPGHGGILDRFDSMIVVAPLTEALLLLIPFAVK